MNLEAGTRFVEEVNLITEFCCWGDLGVGRPLFGKDEP